jgi:hypothetical protein
MTQTGECELDVQKRISFSARWNLNEESHVVLWLFTDLI